MSRTTQAMYEGKVPEDLGTANVLVVDLYPQLLHGGWHDDLRRVLGTGAVGLDIDIGWAVPERYRQQNKDAAANDTYYPESTLPTNRTNQVADQRGHDSRSNAARSP